MDEKSRRVRGKNFSLSEEVLLIQLTKGHKDIIDNRKSDAATWRQKMAAWEKIMEDFVTQSGVERSWKTLKEKYENLKRKSKRELATEAPQPYPTLGSTTTSNGYESKNHTRFLRPLTSCQQSTYGSDENNDELFEPVLHIKTEKLSPHTPARQKSTVYEYKTPKSTSIRNHIPLKQRKAGNMMERENMHDEPECTMEEEKKALIKIQQNFYKNESKYAAEKHKRELKVFDLKIELLELEIAEKKRRLEIF
ncbi:uncharacterized protein LOC115626077 [Scaptodrosophila lebanonensis]|uniref:Regulatory protein zeste n=1 Tax=Drosophila lebanonensis TaxID=7225 RepID=A0A6J2TNU2_DROLE|nr:uncharacterized protein LOC115626077 [Scaptodrosophila lebanonensis]